MCSAHKKALRSDGYVYSCKCSIISLSIARLRHLGGSALHREKAPGTATCLLAGPLLQVGSNISGLPAIERKLWETAKLERSFLREEQLASTTSGTTELLCAHCLV